MATATVIDDFEDGNITEYTGDTNKFSVVTSPVQSGSYALQGKSGEFAYSITSSSGLNYYPQRGTKFEIWLQFDDDSCFVAFDWAGGTYEIRVDTAGMQFKNTLSDSVAFSTTTGTYHRVVVDFGATTSDTISAEFFEGGSTSLGTISGVDTTSDSGSLGVSFNDTSPFDAGADVWVDTWQTVPPQGPSGVSQTNNGDDSITISWTDNASTEDSYALEVSEDGGAWSSAASLSADTTSTTQTVATGTDSFRWRVRAERSDGSASDWAYSTTKETDISSVTLDTAVEDEITVSWDDVDDETEYDILRAESSGTTRADYTTVATVSADTTQYTDTSLEDGEQYFYRVDAVYSGTNSLSGEASATTDLPAPTLDSVDATAEGEITLRYSINDDSSDGDILFERSTDGGSTWTTVDTITIIGDGTYVDSGLLDGEEYTYRVTRRTDHASQQTGTDAAVTPLPAASSPTVTGVTGDQISISWTDNADNEDGYRVYVSDDGGATWTNDSGDLPADTTSYQTTNLLDGERYILLVEVFTEHTAVDTMASQGDTVSTETSLNDGQAVQVQFGSGIIGRTVLMIDDQTGGAPATYDLKAEVKNPVTGKWMPLGDELTGVTHKTITDDIHGDQLRYTLTNQSGGSASFQIRGVALNEGL